MKMLVALRDMMARKVHKVRTETESSKSTLTNTCQQGNYLICRTFLKAGACFLQSQISVFFDN